MTKFALENNQKVIPSGNQALVYKLVKFPNWNQLRDLLNYVHPFDSEFNKAGKVNKKILW